MTTPNDWAPAKKAEATTNISTLNYSTSTAAGNANPLRAINVADLINATAPKAPEALSSKGPEDLEPCTCELSGRCAGCDRLPAVLQQRLLAGQGQTSQTVETVNGSLTSWGSLSRQWQ